MPCSDSPGSNSATPPCRLTWRANGEPVPAGRVMTTVRPCSESSAGGGCRAVIGLSGKPGQCTGRGRIGRARPRCVHYASPLPPPTPMSSTERQTLARKLVAFMRDEIPLAKSMDLRLHDCDEQQLSIAAPLSPNINDKG